MSITTWWCTTTNKLRYNDNREVKAGETHTVDENYIEINKHGLHGCNYLWRCLADAGVGSIYHFWRVRLSGITVRGNYRFVDSEREYLYCVSIRKEDISGISEDALDKLIESKSAPVEKAMKALEASLKALEVVEQARWKTNGKYYYIDTYGEVRTTSDEGWTGDKKRYGRGNYFKTEQDAKRSTIYNAFNSEHEFWFPGCDMEKPSEMPEGCEYWRISTCKWAVSTDPLRRWTATRRNDKA